MSIDIRVNPHVYERIVYLSRALFETIEEWDGWMVAHKGRIHVLAIVFPA
jgi:hypothetical protein